MKYKISCIRMKTNEHIQAIIQTALFDDLRKLTYLNAPIILKFLVCVPLREWKINFNKPFIKWKCLNYWTLIVLTEKYLFSIEEVGVLKRKSYG